ncbi:related to pleiotropic drug resistance control protein PDR6 [Rhynchosporium graminicola]|uniref:Related to pleiotropic drug resistance control protein PDR6 n=1 Tax=Rhynchosporium graminicola TaxID=2792576 RepID=A0A1E1L294_9HELO|nr:related to pleiotropic drug resistance control protein PDR6 [Rhynchosporium commune]
MAQAVPNPPNDKKRVKVYELKNNDWFDRGTGFCIASFIYLPPAVELGSHANLIVQNELNRQEEPRVLVQSEDEPDKVLLETRICKEDSFQKQQDTLIVWTETTTSVDMALSFQEGDGCAAIWKFINNIQQQLLAVGGPDDALSDDISPDAFVNNQLVLPHPGLGNLGEVESQVRNLHCTLQGREALVKYLLNEEINYIIKLIPLVEMAEDMEDLASLHRLCNIMKTFILLNDNNIMDLVVSDELILGVVGALEYDPDFPSHKANHRQWLSREGRYKEVVHIADETIRKKIHATYRLQYLKDVVLARILDDPTFSVLNSLIFYNQVDIVAHLQTNPVFLKELFGVFGPQETDQERKKEAVLFIQQCCAIAKNIQQPTRQQLYNNFIAHGLLSVIKYALRHSDVGVRVGATDVLVSMIDHDPQMIRQTIFRQINEKQTPLTDSLIDLLLVEADLGVKAQIADAIKVLLDPGPQNNNPHDNMARGNGDLAGRTRPQPDPQQAEFVKDFYDDSAKKLFKPLVDLKDRDNLNFNVHEVSLFIYLIEILCFFVRQHTDHSKYFVLSENLGQRIAQLLSSPEKYLRLTALKFFRNLIGLQDEFYNQQMTQGKLFEPILDLIIETMPRDNLLNSACLEFFDFIKRENIKSIISHLVENYREKLTKITYVDTFNNYIIRYDQTQGFATNMETSFLDTEEDITPKRPETGRGNRWEGIKDLDAQEEEYFNTSDDEDDVAVKPGPRRTAINGASPASKPLVDYNSDEENEDMETDLSAGILEGRDENTPPSDSSKESSVGVLTPLSPSLSPPEKISEKRRREEEEDDDEMSKLTQPKRRNSTSSVSSNTSSVLRRKKSYSSNQNGASSGKNKISISLSPAIKTGGDQGGEDSGS